MKVRKVFRKRLDRNEQGVNVAATIDAVVSANVNESDSKSHVSSSQRIVQRSGRTVKSETRTGDRNERDPEA